MPPCPRVGGGSPGCRDSLTERRVPLGRGAGAAHVHDRYWDLLRRRRGDLRRQAAGRSRRASLVDGRRRGRDRAGRRRGVRRGRGSGLPCRRTRPGGCCCGAGRHAIGAVVTAGLVHLVDAHARAGHRTSHRSSALGPWERLVGHRARWARRSRVAICPWVSRRGAGSHGPRSRASPSSFVTNPVSFNTLLAVLAGWTAGTAVVVLAGSPSLRPTTAAITTGCARSGSTSPTSSRPASMPAVDALLRRRPRRAQTVREGARPGRAQRGPPVPPLPVGSTRDLGDEKPFSTLRRTVEHEALVSLAARDLGIRTPRLVAFATAAPDGFVLAYEARRRPSLDRVATDGSPTPCSTGVVAAGPAPPAPRRAPGPAPGERVPRRSGDALLIDFGFSSSPPPTSCMATDVAELLAPSATSVGADRRRAGSRAIGDEGDPYRARPARAAVAQRRDTYRDEGGPDAARRSPPSSRGPARSRCGQCNGIASSAPTSRPTPSPAVTSRGLWAPT